MRKFQNELDKAHATGKDLPNELMAEIQEEVMGGMQELINNAYKHG